MSCKETQFQIFIWIAPRFVPQICVIFATLANIEQKDHFFFFQVKSWDLRKERI